MALISEDMVRAIAERLVPVVLDEAKALPVGTKRTWAGKEYIKGHDGKWKEIKQGKSPGTPVEKEKSHDRDSMEKHVWDNTHKDYKAHFQGKKAVLIGGPNGAALTPLDKMSDDELKAHAEKLGYGKPPATMQPTEPTVSKGAEAELPVAGKDYGGNPKQNALAAKIAAHVEPMKKDGVKVSIGKSLSGMYAEVTSGRYTDRYSITDGGVAYRSKRETWKSQVDSEGDKYHLDRLNGIEKKIGSMKAEEETAVTNPMKAIAERVREIIFEKPDDEEEKSPGTPEAKAKKLGTQPEDGKVTQPKPQKGERGFADVHDGPAQAKTPKPVDPPQASSPGTPAAKYAPLGKDKGTQGASPMFGGKNEQRDLMGIGTKGRFEGWSISEDKALVAKVVAELKKIESAANALSALYEQHEELNSAQPPLTEKVFPMSLDEWAQSINALIAQWSKQK